MRKRKIGIIGGMGPESTVLLYQKIIKSFQENFGSYKDKDFPEIFIHSLPIPDIVIDIKEKKEKKIEEMLLRSLLLLEQAGSDFVAYPCNTLDLFLDFMRSRTVIPVISIIEETCKILKRENTSEILLLSTPTTYEKSLYRRYLSQTKIAVPKDFIEIKRIILKVLKGGYPKAEFEKILKEEYSNYDKIVIGCTDLSILLRSVQDIKIIDSLTCLSDSIVCECIQK